MIIDKKIALYCKKVNEYLDYRYDPNYDPFIAEKKFNELLQLKNEIYGQKEKDI